MALHHTLSPDSWASLTPAQIATLCLLCSGCTVAYLWARQQRASECPLHAHGFTAHHEHHHNNNTAAASWLLDPEKVRLLYHQLHNMEDNPEILPTAHEALLAALDLAVDAAKALPAKDSILALPKYSARDLTAWIERRDDDIMEKFEAYTKRRRSGQPRELLPTKDHAITWLRAQTPLRFVDGAWLGHLSRVDSLWTHQQVVRQLWQITSEELGDGDISKHHARIYAQLLETTAPDMPAAHSAAFMDRRHGTTDDSVWRAALPQLLISLFHKDLMPEMLGFNLHFEGITLGMLQAATEMTELGLDATYFMLHVSIDNAASGHTAMALDAVVLYLEQVREKDGEGAVEQAWRRVQAGYLLSEGAWVRRIASQTKSSADLEQAVGDIFLSKAKSGCKLHCRSQSKIGKSTVVEWLDPSQLDAEDRGANLVQALARSRYWVTPGNSDKSRFMKELLWGGRMFGAFTEGECNVVREWINGLAPLPVVSYASFTGHDHHHRPDALATKDAASFGPMLPSRDAIDRLRQQILQDSSATLLPSQISVNGFRFPVDVAAVEKAKTLPVMWFAHFRLLEGFLAIPSKNGDALGGLILRILRAQYGFDELQYSVTGNVKIGSDDHSSASEASFFDMGMQILAHHGVPASVGSLDELLSLYPAAGELPKVMMQLATAPNTCKAILLGMAAAFVPLRRAVAASSILDDAMRPLLARMADFEEEQLAECLRIVGKENQSATAEFWKGFQFARTHLTDALSKEE